MSLVTISDSAVTYLQDLLNSQEEETNIKIFVSDPGTMRAETCIVQAPINKTECQPFGDYYVYTLGPRNCSAECTYDDSNEQTDCEFTPTHNVGDSRPCWVFYENNECTACDCSNCDDDNRGDSP